MTQSPVPTCLAQRRAQASPRGFSELFRNQYVLDENPNAKFPGWSRKTLNGWTLYHGFGLRVLEILDAAQTPVGYLLGYALHADSQLVRDYLRLPARYDAPNFWDQTQALIAGLSGRYLAIVLTPLAQRIYTDPVSDIPVIYDRKSRRVGSSLGLVLTRDMRPNPLFPAKRVLSGKQILSFGHTLDGTARRAYPNHVFDLSDFSQRRYWPTEDTVLNVGPRQLEGVFDEMADRLSAHLATWLTEFKCALPITGGRDSRALLACAKGHWDDVAMFMAHRFNNNTRKDAKSGQQIMDDLGYPFHHFFYQKNTLRDLSDMRLKMGWSGTRGELGALAAMEQYPRDLLILRGNIMELIRANQYRSDRMNDRQINLRHALRRSGAELTPTKANMERWHDIYMGWHNSLPPNAQDRIYDFNFVELRLPNTQSSYMTAMHGGPFINPFNDRRLIELAISISPIRRYSENYYLELITRRAPELLGYPFN
jgi:hypothetical protein